MVKNALWHIPAGPLKDLAERFAIKLERLHRSEAPGQLTVTEGKIPLKSTILDAKGNIDEKKLKRIHGALCRMWVSYKPALKLRLSYGAADLIVNADYDKGKLRTFFEDIKGGRNFEAQIIINKDELLNYWGFKHSGVTFKLFLFKEALQSALDVPLVDLEKDPEQREEPLLKDFNGESKFIILVPDHPIELNGDYLTMLGGDAVARWQEYKPSKKTGELRRQITSIHKQARNKLKWVHIDLENLTPLQFRVAAAKSGDSSEPFKDDPIAGALYAHSLACSLLHIAAHSSLNRGTLVESQNDDGVAHDSVAEQYGSSWTATFSAAKGVVSLCVGDTPQLREVLVSNSTGSPWKTAQTIADLAAWLYEQERDVGNRLIVLQHSLVSTLEDNEPSQALCQFVRRASEIATRVEWGWTVFIEEKLESYFSREKELEETVESTTKAYNEQVQTLTKTLIDNMLAAVAVVVGSFIAAIFKSPFQAYVFWVGTGIYAAYLFIFPMGVGLTSTLERFDDSKKSFEKRKEEFKKRLTQEQIEKIVGKTITDREEWFSRWFRKTRTLYRVVLLFMIVAMVVVPLIKRWSDDFVLTDVSYGGPPIATPCR